MVKPFIEIEGQIINTSEILMISRENQNDYFHSTLNAYWLHVYMVRGRGELHILFPSKEKRDSVYRRFKYELEIEAASL